MWIGYALGSALFAGLTSILAKCGIRRTDSTVATAIRTVVVLVFAWLMVFLTGAQRGLSELDAGTLVFLVFSGLATGASWLCYFKALQLGDVSRVAPIDKSSTVLTMLMAFLFLGEGLTWLKVVSMLLIGGGTLLMIQKKAPAEGTGGRAWLFFAFGSAFFASLTSILGKVGIAGVNSDLGTAIRTVVVLVMAWLMVLVTGKRAGVRRVERRELGFLCLSGLATGASWLCYYRALQLGPASVVVPIDKLSILVTVLFARLVLGERLSPRAALGLGAVTAGTLLLLV